MPDLNDAPAASLLELPLQVRYGEVGEDGVVTLSALANWLQEAAGQNAALLGFGDEALAPLGLTWILTRLVLRIRNLPGPEEHVVVRTWPSGRDRFAHRGYELLDRNGTLLAEGGSAWSLLNVTQRRMAPLPQELLAAYVSHPRPCAPFLCRTLPRLPELPEKDMFSAPIRVRRDDLDINRHVNNAHYLTWLLEPLPAPSTPPGQRPAPRFPRLLDLTFRAECFPGDELLSLCAPVPMPEDAAVEGPLPRRAFSHSIRRGGDEACRALSLWDIQHEAM